MSLESLQCNGGDWPLLRRCLSIKQFIEWSPIIVAISDKLRVCIVDRNK